MSTAKIVELTDANTCKLCENALARYSCPRCNVPYCSLACYRSGTHLQCSESFYRECVEGELALDSSADDESRRKIEEMLERNRFEDEEDLDSDDAEEASGLEERLAGIDLNDAGEVWEKLTNDERQEFMAFLKSGDVSQYVPKWKPWWVAEEEGKVVEIKDCKEGCPEVREAKPFRDISSKPPADCVTYNLVNVLASYVFTTRYFNGDYYDFGKEAVSCIVTLSLCLNNNENFPDFSTAVKSVEQQILNTDWISADSENFNTMREDLDKVLIGPDKAERKYYVTCALSDLWKLMQSACKTKETKGHSEFSKHFPDPVVSTIGKEKIKASMRKIDYFLSYTKDCLKL